MIRAAKTFIKSYVNPKFQYLRRFPLKRGDVVLDLGANVGEVMEYFLMQGCIVYGYEPNPKPFKTMQERCGQNKNAHLFCAAISNYEGSSKLFLHKEEGQSDIDYSQAASLKSEKNNLGAHYIDVQVLDIRNVLEAHDHIALLKVDIEGGEYDIIDHILEFAPRINVILLETHGDKNPAFEKKEEELHRKIQASPHKNKFYTDWF